MTLILHTRTEQSLHLFLANPGHAVGVVGPSGAGKDHLSLYIAAKLLNNSLEQVQNHPYVFMINVDVEDGIERVRELQSFLSLAVPGKALIRRCVIIRELQKLNHAAQNALLKTLEEPPADTVLICTTDSNKNVLPTISSRLQWINILPISLEQAELNFNTFPPNKIERAYYISEGNAGLLHALLEQMDSHPLSVAIAQAKVLLKASAYERLAQTDAIIKDKSNNISDLLDAFYKLLHAATILSANASSGDLRVLNRQVAAVLRAQHLLESRVQSKLVLSWLFYSL